MLLPRNWERGKIVFEPGLRLDNISDVEKAALYLARMCVAFFPWNITDDENADSQMLERVREFEEDLFDEIKDELMGLEHQRDTWPKYLDVAEAPDMGMRLGAELRVPRGRKVC